MHNGFKVFPLGNCDPTGLDLGPGTDMIAVCRQATTGALLTAIILNRVTGAILATLNAGGGDQVWYDTATNRGARAADLPTPRSVMSSSVVDGRIYVMGGAFSRGSAS